MKVCIIIPTLDEAGTIDILCTGIHETIPSSRILVVDDNSNDGTIEKIQALMEQGLPITLIVRPNRMGIGSAHKFGLDWAFVNRFDLAITMDADLTHNPQNLPSMINESSNFDIVVGSRFVPGGGLENWSISRRLLTSVGHLLTKTALRFPFDASAGFRAYNLSSHLIKTVYEAPSDSYSFFLESMTLLVRSGYSIGEIPVKLPKRTYGSSKMQLSDIVQSVKQLSWAARQRSRTKFSD